MTPEVVTCDDLDRAIAEQIALGYRLDATGPADEPTWAELSKDGHVRYLDAAPEGGSQRFASAELAIPRSVPSLTVSHEAATGWSIGRAGMAYRDLIPDRFGGAYIASHINVKTGGPVPDYVHHHDVALQLIYCHRGWVRVVYQDQGPPFVLHPGDLVLQPPGIRHQVLESSDDLFVTEVSCPADHRTSLDHDLVLPTADVEPDALYGRGQRFLRHIAIAAPWQPLPGTPFEFQPTGLAVASDGFGQLRFLRATEGSIAAASGQGTVDLEHDLDLCFVFVTAGSVELLDEDDSITERLVEGSSVAAPSGRSLRLSNPAEGTGLLELKCRRA